MIGHLKLLGGLLVGVFRSHAVREAEIAFLASSLLCCSDPRRARLRLRTADRLIFVWLYRLFPSLLEAAVVFKGERHLRLEARRTGRSYSKPALRRPSRR